MDDLSTGESDRLHIGRRAMGIALAVLAVAALLGAFGAWRARRAWTETGDRSEDRGAPEWPVPTFVPPQAARVFAAAPDGDTDPRGGAARFRLAGTFLLADAEPPVRRAILDDRVQGRQSIVGEGDTVGDLRIVRIHPDRVRAVFSGRDIEILRAEAGAEPGATRETAEAPAPDAEAAEEGEPVRFGRRVDERRWEFEREALIDYYREMLDAPDRVARLYRSFRPVRDAEGAVAGYRIDIRGEREFLTDVGLREGDRITAVNSLPLTSQSRAEYFLGEFIRGDLGAVVLDVERDGETQKLIYRFH